MIIGVTGLIGSGKTEVARVFQEEGAVMIDADAIGREVVENDPMVMYRLVLAFGDSILDRKKLLDRRQLGRLAFASPEKTELLNGIVHPALLAELDRRMTIARKSRKTAVIDAALLVYWKYHKKTDLTVLVISRKNLCLERLKHKGLSQSEICRRIKSQLPLSQLKAAADYIITNNSSLEDLKEKARELYRRATEKG